MSLSSRCGVTVAALLAVASLVRCAAPDDGRAAEVSPTNMDAGAVDSRAMDAPLPDAVTPDRAAPDASSPDALESDVASPDVAPIPKTAVRVLFIGNSYTAFNNLPNVLATLTANEASPISVTIGAHTPDGARWE